MKYIIAIITPFIVAYIIRCIGNIKNNRYTHVSDQEYDNFCKFMKEYNEKKNKKKNR